MAVHGTRRGESVSWDYEGLLQLLSSLARERSGLPVLRCYWYEATLDTPRSWVLRAALPDACLSTRRLGSQVMRHLVASPRSSGLVRPVTSSPETRSRTAGRAWIS